LGVRRALIGSLLSLSACYSISSATVGPAVVSRESSCGIVFSRERAQDLSVDYDQVGVICFSGAAAEWPVVAVAGRQSDLDRIAAYRPGKGHEAVRREACSLGGDLVAPIGICGKFPYDLELGVWRRKQ